MVKIKIKTTSKGYHNYESDSIEGEDARNITLQDDQITADSRCSELVRLFADCLKGLGYAEQTVTDCFYDYGIENGAEDDSDPIPMEYCELPKPKDLGFLLR